MHILVRSFVQIEVEVAKRLVRGEGIADIKHFIALYVFVPDLAILDTLKTQSKKLLINVQSLLDNMVGRKVL